MMIYDSMTNYCFCEFFYSTDCQGAFYLRHNSRSIHNKSGGKGWNVLEKFAEAFKSKQFNDSRRLTKPEWLYVSFDWEVLKIYRQCLFMVNIKI